MDRKSVRFAYEIQHRGFLQARNNLRSEVQVRITDSVEPPVSVCDAEAQRVEDLEQAWSEIETAVRATRALWDIFSKFARTYR